MQQHNTSRIKFVLDPSDIQQEDSIALIPPSENHVGPTVKRFPQFSVSPEISLSREGNGGPDASIELKHGERAATRRIQMESVEMDEKEEDDPLPEIPIRYEELENTGLVKKQGAGSSKYASNASSLNSKYPYAREISETIPRRLLELRWVWVALLVNLGLIYFVMRLVNGIYIPVEESTFVSAGAVIFEVIMLVANVVTSKALNDGTAAWFGSLLCSKGTSAVVCGFYQAGPLSKLSFANQLSLNSSVRTTLTRASFLWFLTELMLIVSTISATALTAYPTVEDRGYLGCVEFGESGTPVDRGFPTIDAEIGFAALVFGTGLGKLRSELDSANTTFMIGPQIIGAVADGDKIHGKGFITTISTSCLCTANGTAPALIEKGVNASLAPELMERYNSLGSKIKGLASIVETNSTMVSVTSLIAGSDNCGGIIGTSFIPLCVTRLTDHYRAMLKVEYMTDGTPASVAIKKVSLDYILGKADISWLSKAIINIMGGTLNSFQTPQTVPGMLSPIFLWTSPDLLAMDPSLLEGGIETTFAILLRAGIQRTYATKGTKCAHTVFQHGMSLVFLETYGFLIAIIILGLQTFITVLAFFCFLPWLFAKFPQGPGVRAVRDNVYFATLVSASHAFTNFDQLCNAESHALWQNLDVVVRVGEPIGMRDEEVGRVALDRPKIITTMVNGKKYY